MKNRDLQTERLEELSRRLMKSTRINRDEMENLLANPRLFDSVKVRIRHEEKTRPQTENLFGNWQNLFNFRRAIQSFAVLLILIALVTLAIFKNQRAPQIAEQKIFTEPVLAIQQNEISINDFEIKNIKSPAVKNAAKIEKAAFKPKEPKQLKPAKERGFVKPTANLKKQSPEVFYSLGFGDDWEKNGEDLRVVRTEITSSELIALGMNLPVENESVKVKTDLLIGADGVARAIRFVE